MLGKCKDRIKTSPKSWSSAVIASSCILWPFLIYLSIKAPKNDEIILFIVLKAV